MRRKDREITDLAEVVSVLERCEAVSIGFQGEDGPYVVPVSFGLRPTEDTLCLYFHGAREGRKAEAIQQNPRVCVEGHIVHGVVRTAHGITTHYESVIGFGVVCEVEGEEALAGLQAIVAHQRMTDYAVETCAELPHTAVYRVRLERLTGKRNLPG